MRVSSSAWKRLSSMLTGPLIFPGDKGYESAVQSLNLRYASKRAAAVARCTSPKDVSQCLVWCADFNYPFAVKSGGHSYAGYSRTNGLLVDLSLMNDCSYDPATGILHVSGGALIRDLLMVLKGRGRAFTHGQRWLGLFEQFWCVS